VRRRAGAPPLFLLTLFTCFAPVESAAALSGDQQDLICAVLCAALAVVCTMWCGWRAGVFRRLAVAILAISPPTSTFHLGRTHELRYRDSGSARNSGSIFMLTMFACIAPVESATVHSLASAVATVRGFMTQHAFYCCGLLFFIALRSVMRIYFALSEEPATTRVPTADASYGVLHAMASASRFLSGVPATIYGSTAAACSYTWDLLLQLRREHCTFVAAVTAGDGVATDTYWSCSVLLLVLSVLVPLCAEWSIRWCVAIPPAVLAATALYVRLPAATIPGSVMLVVLQLVLVIGRLAGFVGAGTYLRRPSAVSHGLIQQDLVTCQRWFCQPRSRAGGYRRSSWPFSHSSVQLHS
jgi:hypothetical protein